MIQSDLSRLFTFTATDSTDSQGSSSQISSSQIFKLQLPLIQIALLMAELLLALPLGGMIATLWQGGIAWIVGGIASGVLVLYGYRWFYHRSVKPNATARKMGQGLVGMTIGFSIAHSNLAQISTDLPIFMVLTLFLLLSGTAIGYLYSRFSQTNLLTSLLATVPGGVSIMSSIAAEYGRNVALVSLVQIIRVTAVIILIPLIARATAAQEISSVVPVAPALSPPLDAIQLLYLLLALLLTGGATLLLTRWKVPAAPFVAGLAAGILFNPLLSSIPLLPAIDFTPPSFISVLGQILLGITIGEYWGNKPKVGKQAVMYALVSVGMTLAAGLIATALAMQLTDWDWLTCLLVTAPGGAPEMILVALTLNHKVELVTAGHLVRLIAINSSLPLWIYLFRSLDQHLATTKVEGN